MLPNVNLTINDPGLGSILPNTGNAQVKIGATTKGTANTLYGVGSVQAVRDAVGYGPAAEAAIAALGGGTVYVMPVTIAAASYGSFGTAGFSLTGAGPGTVTGSTGPRQLITIKISTGGTLGTMAFQVKIGAGSYGAPVTSAASPNNTYQIPGEKFTTLTFTAGTYVQDDVYTIATTGVVTPPVGGTPPSVTAAHSAVDRYALAVEITTGGALGTAAFKYSLDGGETYTAPIMTVSGGVHAIDGTGIVLTFASTFTAGDVYTNTSSAPAVVTNDVGTAITALLADSTSWGFLHVVGTPSDASSAYTLANAVATQMDTAEAAYRYAFAVTECAQSATVTDALIRAAFVAFESPRVMVCAGDCDLQNATTYRNERRNIAWAVTRRMAEIKLSKDPAAVSLGPLPGVTAIYRDEQATPGLDDARVTTLRSFTGLAGYYVTNARMMSAGDSDFIYVMNRRVMDRGCTVARSAYLLYVNEDVRIDEETGFIDERDAQAIDGQVEGKLSAALIDSDEASSLTALISRTDDLLATSTANAEVAIVPKGYLKTINVKIGFRNPARS
jgi:hypothetical protein